VGDAPDTPFVLVAQQSLFDGSRAPPGKHTGWGYCHVPNGSAVDMTQKIEAQMDRFAPGFLDLVLARHTMTAVAVEAHNASFVGGDIGGGANDLEQLLARPVLRWNAYATPNPRLFLASSATAPGGGVHGMCGYWAARAALKSVFGRSPRGAP
jgi:phytoene dehydrogenase-like protein